MERKNIKVNFVLLILIFVLVVAQIYIVNKHSTIGDQLTMVNKQIGEVEEENSQISQKIASLSAMTTITEKAKQYGFVSSIQVLSIANSLPIASNLRLSL